MMFIQVVIHKGKKMNYVCSINPGKITKLSGKITDLGTGFYVFYIYKQC